MDQGKTELQLIKEVESLISSLPSHVYFADEQDTRESLLFGGYCVHRERLTLLDQEVEAAKRSVGLDAENAIKASPPQTVSFMKLRSLSREQRSGLRSAMLAILDKLDAVCFFSMVWKYDPSFSPKAYQWAFDNVLQRLVISVKDRVRARGAWYPALDVVVDWFPNPTHCKEYFAKYHKAYYEGYDFRYLGKNKLPPLKQLHACPCLLVTSCEFSPALQLADYCVFAMGELLRWAYNRKEPPEEIRPRVEKVIRHLLRGDGQVIGKGLVLPTKGQARNKVRSALADLDLLSPASTHNGIP